MELAQLVQHDFLTDPDIAGEWSAVLPDIAAAAAPPPWCAYLAKDGGLAVGVGLFKGPPDEEQWAEIAYLTFRPCIGRGVATEVARALVAIAHEHGARGVRAHTLREPNSSSRVLEKLGFELSGEVLDPDDGPVWRWELAF